MSKKKKKKRLKLFYPIYFSLLILAAAAIWYGCGRLTPYLADYERANPKYAAEDAMRAFDSADAQTFCRYAQAQHPELFQYESEADYIAWMNALTQNASFDYTLAYSDDPAVKKYAVKMNGKRFGSFSLREQPHSSEYGFSTWTFESLETILPEATEYYVTAPSDASVFAGDQPLTAEDAVETGIATPWTGRMLLEETPSPSLTRYAFRRFFGCPTVRATDAAGQPCAVSGDEASGFIAARNEDEALRAATEARVAEIVKAFSLFTSSDLSTHDMLKLARKGTKGYSIIQNFDNNWFGRHTITQVQNLTTSNYIRFTEDTMACDASYDYMVRYTDGDKIYPTAYRFYLVLRNDVWYLYDFEAIS